MASYDVSRAKDSEATCSSKDHDSISASFWCHLCYKTEKKENSALVAISINSSNKTINYYWSRLKKNWAVAWNLEESTNTFQSHGGSCDHRIICATRHRWVTQNVDQASVLLVFNQTLRRKVSVLALGSSHLNITIDDNLADRWQSSTNSHLHKNSSD